ncbi:MAG: GerMN domain-containing protein [Syntrophomonadaceae bacterium]|nr:GerMN domain-containing protein [Syntrophomonadaceae bacterium]
MSRKIIIVLALIILAVCLTSGGCYSPPASGNIKALKDLIKLVPEKENKQEVKGQQEAQPPESKTPAGETMPIKLYFARSGQEGLEVENRTVARTQGIARKTMEELIKGPQSQGLQSVFPSGTTLRDINIKADGICVVDLSEEVRSIESPQDEKLMIQAISSTLGQFSTIEGVTFMVDGQEVQSINGGVDLSSPVKPALNQ